MNDTETKARYNRQRARLLKIAKVIAEKVAEKDEHYGSSWRKRNGPGAFFTIIRKFDRFEASCKEHNYDLFKCFETDKRAESIIDDCSDIIGYLLVLLEHMVEVGNVTELFGEYVGLFADEYDKTTKVNGAGPPCPRTEHPNPFGYNEREDVYISKEEQ